MKPSQADHLGLSLVPYSHRATLDNSIGRTSHLRCCYISNPAWTTQNHPFFRRTLKKRRVQHNSNVIFFCWMKSEPNTDVKSCNKWVLSNANAVWSSSQTVALNSGTSQNTPLTWGVEALLMSVNASEGGWVITHIWRSNRGVSNAKYDRQTEVPSLFSIPQSDF